MQMIGMVVVNEGSSITPAYTRVRILMPASVRGRENSEGFNSPPGKSTRWMK